jgi:ribose/xylose/arabinose/galactoside ABC-type transport system permease subunit
MLRLWRARSTDMGWVVAVFVVFAVLNLVFGPPVSVFARTCSTVIIHSSTGLCAASGLAGQAAGLALLAVGQAILLRVRRVEPAMLAIAGMAAAVYAVVESKLHDGHPTATDSCVALLAAAGIAVAAGLFSGLLATVLRSLDTFAASAAIFFGLGIVIDLIIDTDTDTGSVALKPEGLLGRAGSHGMDGDIFPVLILIAAVILVVVAASPLLRGTPQEVKSMPKPAVVATYVAAALVSAAGGLITVGWAQAVDVNVASEGKELLILTAVLVGGASLYGGRGSVLGMVGGALLVMLIVEEISVRLHTGALGGSIVSGVCGLIAVICFALDHTRDHLPENFDAVSATYGTGTRS